MHELVSHVESAEDGQVVDLVGGDFNCTPGSDLYRELANSLGRTVQQLGGEDPFVTWDGLSEKPGSGQTLDHIFIRARSTFQKIEASQRVAFTASSMDQRLSDHLGIEAAIRLSLAPSLARVAGKAFGSSLSSAANPDRVAFIGGNKTSLGSSLSR